ERIGTSRADPLRGGGVHWSADRCGARGATQYSLGAHSQGTQETPAATRALRKARPKEAHPVKPLREQKVFASESERELAELFMAAERYRPSPFSKRRINAQLASAGRRRILRTWQPAVSAALFLAGSAAAATLGHRWLSEERPAEQPPLVLQQPMQSAH